MIQRIKKSTQPEFRVAGLTVPELIALKHQMFGGTRMGPDDDKDDKGDTDDDSGDDADDSDADADADDEDDASGDGKKGKKDGKEGTERERELSAEARKRRLQARDEKARADKAEKELQDLKDKDKPEVEKLTKQVDDLTKSNEGLQRDLTQARLNNAFLTDNTYEWQNPADALRLADLDDVEVDEDGKVTGLKEALKKLAKERPYLLKATKGKKQGDADDDGDDADDEGGPTGHSGNGRKTDTKKLDKAKLAKKYGVRR